MIGEHFVASLLGRGCGLVVSVFAFYSNDQSLNPAKVYNIFSVDNMFEKK